MDTTAFDRIVKGFGARANRRASLRAALGAALGLAAAATIEATEAKPQGRGTGTRRKPHVEGPCGNGSRKDNACRKDKECCTGYCQKVPKNKDGKGRCRCIKNGNPCTSDQTCCKSATCQQGVCSRGPAPVPTGQSCDPATDTCADAAAVCQGYDSDDPAGTYCLLPTGAACAGNGDCYSQECSGGTCAAVTCTVCASGCPFSDLASAIASPPPDGRIKIAPGTWTNTAGSADITQSMRIEACGGAPGVILLPTQYYLLNPTAGVTLTVKNLEFGYSDSHAALGGSGTSAQAMATLNAINCTFQGGQNYLSLYPYDYFTATITNCTMNSAPVYAGTNAVGDPSTLTFENCSFTGATVWPVIDLGGDLDVTFTGCTISGSASGGIKYGEISKPTSPTVTLTDTIITGNAAASATGGGGIYANAANGASITFVLGDGVSITGNTAAADRGSGILTRTATGGVVTITGAPGKVGGNTPNPQCATTTDGTTFSPVPNCAY